jgi:hypothetical protein
MGLSLNNLVVLAAAVAYGWTLAGRLALGLWRHGCCGVQVVGVSVVAGTCL